MISYTLTDEDRAAADKCARSWWSGKRTSNYGKGILRNGRAINTGVWGEIAFAKSFGLEADLEYKHGGGRTDFRLGGMKVDIKTASYFRDSGLITCFNEQGDRVELKSDIYVFGYIDNDEIVNLVGFLPLEEVLLSPVEQGKGSHYNYKVTYDRLIPIEELNSYISQNKSSQSIVA